jgi:hypothetical protein
VLGILRAKIDSFHVLVARLPRYMDEEMIEIFQGGQKVGSPLRNGI